MMRECRPGGNGARADQTEAGCLLRVSNEGRRQTTRCTASTASTACAQRALSTLHSRLCLCILDSAQADRREVLVVLSPGDDSRDGGVAS